MWEHVSAKEILLLPRQRDILLKSKDFPTSLGSEYLYFRQEGANWAVKYRSILVLHAIGEGSKMEPMCDCTMCDLSAGPD